MGKHGGGMIVNEEPGVVGRAVDIQAVAAALAQPFDPDEIKWKPQSIKGDRALAIAYVDARIVMDRLDDVLGIADWMDSYECLPGDSGSVRCTLSLRLGGEWISKSDVGSESEQPDEGDKVKAAHSDSLKRTAVKWGVGRYLYRLKSQWVDYDAQKKRFVNVPQLPNWAIPKKAPHQPQQPAPRLQEEATRRTAEAEAPAKQKQKPTPESLQKYEAEQLVPEGLSEPGEFVTFARLQLDPEPAEWKAADARRCCEDWLGQKVIGPAAALRLEAEMKKRGETWPRVVDSLRAWGERSGVEVPVAGLRPETLTVRLWAKAMSQLAEMPLVAAPAAAASLPQQPAAARKAKAASA